MARKKNGMPVVAELGGELREHSVEEVLAFIRASHSAAPPERSLEEIEAVIRENSRNNTASTYEGLTSAEIAKRNRRLMFGENDEAFPSPEEWSRIVD